jgi:hypothetical protein
MKESKKLLESLAAKSIVDKAEKELAVQSDLEWWSALLECFYGAATSPRKAEGSTDQTWSRH